MSSTSRTSSFKLHHEQVFYQQSCKRITRNEDYLANLAVVLHHMLHISSRACVHENDTRSQCHSPFLTSLHPLTDQEKKRKEGGGGSTTHENPESWGTGELELRYSDTNTVHYLHPLPSLPSPYDDGRLGLIKSWYTSVPLSLSPLSLLSPFSRCPARRANQYTPPRSAAQNSTRLPRRAWRWQACGYMYIGMYPGMYPCLCLCAWIQP